MVSESLLRALNDALIDAGNKRNTLQFGVNDLREVLANAKASLQRAEIQESNAVSANDRKNTEHRELLDYYNGLANKNGLGSILTRIELLASEQLETHRHLQTSRDIRMDCHRKWDQAQTNLAVAEKALEEATKDWQRMSAELEKVRNEK